MKDLSSWIGRGKRYPEWFDVTAAQIAFVEVAMDFDGLRYTFQGLGDSHAISEQISEGGE